MKPTRVAFFVKTFPKLSETFVLGQITGLIDLGVDVEIIALEPSNEPKAHQSYYDYKLADKTTYLCKPESASSGVRLLKRTGALIKLMVTGQQAKANYILDSKLHPYFAKSLYLCRFLALPYKCPDFDLIIAHFGPDGSLAIKLRQLGVLKGPIATVFHGFDMSEHAVIRQYKAAYQEIFSKGELMLPISRLWQQRLQEWGCAADKIQVHRMGVDLTDLPSRPTDKAIQSPLKVVCVGRMTEKKGIPYAVDAVVSAAKHISIQLDIIGGGDLTEQVNAQIQASGAQNYIRCLGAQTQETVKEYLAKSDVFLLPSVTASSGDMEGIPVALMESMASGLITLTTQHSGIPELINDGVHGFLAPERDAQALADKLLEISTLSNDRTQSIRLAAREKVANEFDNQQLNKKLKRIIEQAYS